MEDRNVALRNQLVKLEDRIDSCEKRIFNQQSPTNESDRNQTTDLEPTNENTREPLILMNQLKDGESRQNKYMVNNIPEDELKKNLTIYCQTMRQ